MSRLSALGSAILCALSAGAHAGTVSVLDLVTVGGEGQVSARTRIAQPPSFYLPAVESATPAFDVAALDPILCASFGEVTPAIGAVLTDANGSETLLGGLARIDYLLVDVDGRREIRWQPQRVSGVARVQCSSPGYPLGLSGSRYSANAVFESSFENRDDFADVVVGVGGGWVQSDLIGVTSGSDGARLDIVIRNRGAASTAAIRFREYLRTGSDIAALRVVAGSEPPTCTPIAADGLDDPCAALGAEPGFPLSLDIGSLAPGEGLHLRLHRQLLVPPGSEAQQLAAGYAAFVDPAPADANARADLSLVNNARWLSFAVS